MNPSEPKIEPIVYLLSVLLVFFSGTVFVAEFFFREDGQLFQLFAGLLSGVAGALFMRVKPKSGDGSNGTPPQNPPDHPQT